MTLFVSKLSIGNAGNPIGKEIYDRPCELYNKDAIDFEEDEVEIIESDEVVVIVDDEVLEDYTEDDECEEYDELFKDFLINEFREGKLRQGWGHKYGGHTMDLQDGEGSFRDENGRIQPTPKWVCDAMHLYDWSQKEAVGRFRILSILLDMEDGDIVFVPNIPSNDMFCVATVGGGYEFELMDEYDGHGHIIHVKNVKEYTYGDDTIPKKLWSFPPAVIRIRKDDKFKTFLEKSYFK